MCHGFSRSFPRNDENNARAAAWRCETTSPSSSSDSPLYFLAKTTETFKLAELQLLEIQLQVDSRSGAYSCERLLVDRATGSSLFLLTVHDDDVLLQPWRKNNNGNTFLPSSIRRFEWIARIVARGETAHALLDSIQSLDDLGIRDDDGGWTLDYTRLQSSPALPYNKRDSVKYTSKTLICCVAQSLGPRAALDPRTATDRLLLVDTDDGLFLVQKLDMQKNDNDSSSSGVSFLSKWKQRPFQYSSSINVNVALIVVDLLLDLVQQQRQHQQSGIMNGTNDEERIAIRLLDPTCGSGTFLAAAIDRGATVVVEGWDVNQRCVEGAQRNLEALYGGDGVVSTDCKVCLRDAGKARRSSESDLQLFDCMVANLPWGQNTLESYKENEKIIQNLSSFLVRGAPCAFVTKKDATKQFEDGGFIILGTANIPQRDFVRPKGYKKRLHDGDENDKSTSDCVVTIALAPE
jgi:hypothetical protein